MNKFRKLGFIELQWKARSSQIFVEHGFAGKAGDQDEGSSTRRRMIWQ
jgi:hypothetical protein